MHFSSTEEAAAAAAQEIAKAEQAEYEAAEAVKTYENMKEALEIQENLVNMLDSQVLPFLKSKPEKVQEFTEAIFELCKEMNAQVDSLFSQEAVETAQYPFSILSIQPPSAFCGAETEVSLVLNDDPDWKEFSVKVGNSCTQPLASIQHNTYTIMVESDRPGMVDVYLTLDGQSQDSNIVKFQFCCKSESDGADGPLSDQAGVAIEAGMDHQDVVLRDSSSVAAIDGGEKQQ